MKKNPEINVRQTHFQLERDSILQARGPNVSHIFNGGGVSIVKVYNAFRAKETSVFTVLLLDQQDGLSVNGFKLCYGA